MENAQNNLHNPSDTTVALPQRSLQYGVANSAGYASASAVAVAPDALSKLRFFTGEFFGFLFVVFSTVYIFAVPASLSRPALIKAMVNRSIKRTLDFIGALTGIILCTPFWILVPLAIRLDSRGPIFYSQTRVGVNRRKGSRRCFPRCDQNDRRSRDRRRVDYLGKPFQVMKFRTMVIDAEKLSGPVWATKNDPRITRVGRFLRKTRLDEIPQFVNVLRGEMSLVGPRPERPNFVRELSVKVDNYTERLAVKPGLTGLAQIENGYDSTVAGVAEKVKSDLTYIRNWSLWYDIKIMARTVIVVFTGKGAN